MKKNTIASSKYLYIRVLESLRIEDEVLEYAIKMKSQLKGPIVKFLEGNSSISVLSKREVIHRIEAGYTGVSREDIAGKRVYYYINTTFSVRSALSTAITLMFLQHIDADTATKLVPMFLGLNDSLLIELIAVPADLHKSYLEVCKLAVGCKKKLRRMPYRSELEAGAFGAKVMVPVLDSLVKHKLVEFIGWNNRLRSAWFKFKF